MKSTQRRRHGKRARRGRWSRVLQPGAAEGAGGQTGQRLVSAGHQGTNALPTLLELVISGCGQSTMVQYRGLAAQFRVFIKTSLEGSTDHRTCFLFAA